MYLDVADNGYHDKEGSIERVKFGTYIFGQAKFLWTNWISNLTQTMRKLFTNNL